MDRKRPPPTDQGGNAPDEVGAWTPKKKVRRKKPADKPKRPLSAYNLFFRHARAEVAREAEEAAAQALVSAGGNLDILGGDFPSFQPTKLTQQVAARWRSLSAQEKCVYEREAAKDKVRYGTEIQQWTEEKRNREEQNRHNEAPAAAAASPLRTASHRGIGKAETDHLLSARDRPSQYGASRQFHHSDIPVPLPLTHYHAPTSYGAGQLSPRSQYARTRLTSYAWSRPAGLQGNFSNLAIVPSLPVQYDAEGRTDAQVGTILRPFERATARSTLGDPTTALGEASATDSFTNYSQFGETKTDEVSLSSPLSLHDSILAANAANPVSRSAVGQQFPVTEHFNRSLWPEAMAASRMTQWAELPPATVHHSQYLHSGGYSMLPQQPPPPVPRQQHSQHPSMLPPQIPAAALMGVSFQPPALQHLDDEDIDYIVDTFTSPAVAEARPDEDSASSTGKYS